MEIMVEQQVKAKADWKKQKGHKGKDLKVLKNCKEEN